MSIELLLFSLKNSISYLRNFYKYININTTFYFVFLLHVVSKINILKNFFWKISNFSDLYWFFYVLKDIKTLSYISK